MYYVYIVRCADDSLYTGIAKDLDKRINQHNHDDRHGAAYTRSRRPVKLMYHEKCDSRSTAAKREYQIRHLKKQEKEALVRKL